MAATSGSRADRCLSICGRSGDRLSARKGWEDAPCGAPGQAGAVRPVAPRGQDPARRVRAVRRTEPASRRAATPGDLRLSGLHALLQRDQRWQVVKRKTQAKRMVRKLKALREEMAHRMHTPIREQHRWLC